MTVTVGGKTHHCYFCNESNIWPCVLALAGSDERELPFIYAAWLLTRKVKLYIVTKETGLRVLKLEFALRLCQYLLP